MVLGQVPCRDANSNVGMENTGREEMMDNHGARAEMNENGEKFVVFCQANELVIGGTLFPLKGCHKRISRSPDGVIVNHIDHLAFGRRWRSSLQDVSVLRGTDAGSNLSVNGKSQGKWEGESGRVRFEGSMLKDLEVRNLFKKALHNRFEGLQQLMEEEEL